MKTNFLSKALLVGGMLAMVACSNDEPVIDNGNNDNIPTGDVAYMNVNIKSVNGGASRATSPGYEYGTGDETEVNSAKFMFFDENGLYMNIQANKWEDGGNNQHVEGEPDKNVEHMGKNTIVLRGLKDADKYPSYMLVVLNHAGFTPAATLEETSKALVNLHSSDIDKSFIMSTTSYFAGDASHDKFYYATPVNASDFKPEPATNDGTSNVDVYVERVAAKVTFDAAGTLTAETLADNTKAYPLNITIGGTPNQDGGVGLVEGDNKVYVRVLGWGLNCTPTESYLSKQLDTQWATTPVWNVAGTTNSENWQAAGDFRSFWGKSVVYGINPLDAANVAFIGYNQLEAGLGQAAYTYEHTNTADNVSLKTTKPGSTEDVIKLDKQKVTSILVKAEVCDKDGKGLDLVQVYGINYTNDGYKGLVLNTMSTLGNNMNYYVKIAEAGDPEVYDQLGAEQLDIVSDGTASGVKVVAKLDGITEIYKKIGVNEYEKNDNGATEFANDIEDATEDFNAVAYKGGAMYYTIPVEHLNIDNYDDVNKKYDGIEEGNYGIVRNHVYKVTFSKLAKLGTGVFDPNKEIIPSNEDDDTYFLGATINILSWKIVNQDVEL